MRIAVIGLSKSTEKNKAELESLVIIFSSFGSFGFMIFDLNSGF